MMSYGTISMPSLMIRSMLATYPPRLVACRYEPYFLHSGVVDGAYGFHHIDNSTARSYTDEFGRRVEVFFHCLLGCAAFRGFDGGKGSVLSGRGRHCSGSDM